MQKISIRYIGDKPMKRDTVCRSGVVWARGGVQSVPVEVAQQLLLHPDVWQEADAPYDGEAAEQKAPAKTKRAPTKKAAAKPKDVVVDAPKVMTEEQLAEKLTGMVNKAEIIRWAEEAGIQAAFGEINREDLEQAVIREYLAKHNG